MLSLYYSKIRLLTAAADHCISDNDFAPHAGTAVWQLSLSFLLVSGVTKVGVTRCGN